MRGVGGPLLCIGDLLSDVGEIDGGDHIEPSSVSLSLSSKDPLPVLDLSQLFEELSILCFTSVKIVMLYSMILDATLFDEFFPSVFLNFRAENYKLLNEALSESGHSWTTLTLKLCTALDTADKLIQSANSDTKSLSEKVGILQNIVRCGNSAVKEVKVINGAANIEKQSSSGC